MTPTTHNYQVGSTVLYETFTGTIRQVVVTAKHDDVKNGRPGFDAIHGPEGVWGYDDQIIEVVVP